MKKNSTIKRMFAVAVMLFGTLTSFAQLPLNNVWLKADVYPSGAGKVFVDWYIDEVNMAESSEFKRSADFASSAYILVEPSDGWLFAGVSRDYNKNGLYDNEIDKQLHIWYNHYFDAIYDKTEYFVSGSSTETYNMAQEALKAMTKPTDQVFAVFTKGAVAYRAVGDEARGKVYSSQVYNEPGDQVTFSAYGDSEYQSSTGSNKYFKFDHWTDANGNTVSTDREFTVTVKGMEVYYACFSEISKQEYNETEKDLDPNKIDWYDPEEFPWDFMSVESVKTDSKTDSRIYDLQGRVVTAPQKGVFIRGGKKVVVK